MLNNLGLMTLQKLKSTWLTDIPAPRLYEKATKRLHRLIFSPFIQKSQKLHVHQLDVSKCTLIFGKHIVGPHPAPNFRNHSAPIYFSSIV